MDLHRASRGNCLPMYVATALAVSSSSLASHEIEWNRGVVHVYEHGCRFERIQKAVDAATARR